MVRNLRGGSKHKKAKSSQMSTSEKVIMRDESVGEYYAYVSKAYGSGHFGVHIVYSNEEGLLKLSEKEHKGVFLDACESKNTGILYDQMI